MSALFGSVFGKLEQVCFAVFASTTFERVADPQVGGINPDNFGGFLRLVDVRVKPPSTETHDPMLDSESVWFESGEDGKPGFWISAEQARARQRCTLDRYMLFLLAEP